MNETAIAAEDLSQAARQRFLARERKPLLIGDWTRALFLHFEAPAELVQPYIPFELDLRDGKAFISTVAFSMEGLRPGLGGALGRWLFWPIARHDFFNVRTYVRHNGQPGIYFISERLNNRCCVLGGPLTYGLPYQFARLRYDHRPGEGRLEGAVEDDFAYTAEIPGGAAFQVCAPGSLDEFLIERYTAYTSRARCSRYFDIWHEPWRQIPLEARITNDHLLRQTFPCFNQACLVGANYSPGVHNVWMGAPRRIW